MKVVFSREVREYLKSLSEIMYDKGYFSFLDSSQEYMEALINDIVISLPNRQVKIAPPYFDKYAKDMHYSMFRKSRHTQWYVFFNLFQNENGDLIYLVSFISNNHMIANLL